MTPVTIDPRRFLPPLLLSFPRSVADRYRAARHIMRL